jgi:hypothetical protein
MNEATDVITTVFAAILFGAIAYEIGRRRNFLRELYNVLDEDDRMAVAELDELVASGQLQPYRP